MAEGLAGSTQRHIHVHRAETIEPAHNDPWPGTAIAGDPQTRTWNSYESADGRMLVGTWESTPGTWRIDYADWEYCQFLEGRCIITPDGGTPIVLAAGDVFVIEPGLKGTWEVIETVRKYYVFALGNPTSATGDPLG